MSRSFSVPRTATFAWSKGSQSARGTPLLATGTASGALDESFSSGAALELWDAFGEGDEESRIKGRVSVTSKFNCLSWNKPSDGRPEGVLAAGMDNGELELWDPAKILAGEAEEASIFKTDRHKGTVRGLDWNTLQPSLFASGATDAEIFIWDTKNLTKPYGPSANKSRHLTDITALAWNPSVAHILATASASGSTVIWDLKGRQEVIHLSYLGAQGSVYSQGPKPVSSVCWHAERGTRVITASEDDSAPVVLVWDLRNYRTPERVLTGHEKGVLSLDWCKEDPDLLFSCGKDCRTIAWNPSTGEVVGELPVTNNWSFMTASCPRNPGYVATASFDGKISISSLQSTNQAAAAEEQQAPAASDNAADIFSASNISNLAAQVHPGLSLKQPPRWLKRPVSASFGFGGKLVTSRFQEAPAGPAPQAGTSQIKVHQVTTESDIVERALLLDGAQDSQALAEFCEQKKNKLNSGEKEAKPSEDELSSWKLLSSLFHANSKDELVTLLGFSKEEIQQKVEDAVKSFKASVGQPTELPLGYGNGKSPSVDSREGGDGGSVAREPLVTFADQNEQASNATDALSGSSEGEGAAAKDGNTSASNLDNAPSETEASTSVASDATTKLGGAESELTEPSLFGDDAPVNNAQQQAATDFYSSLGSGTETGRPASITDRFTLSQANVERAGSSVAATVGSRPSSVASESLKPTTFRIYPQGESEADRLLTRALVLGDFDSAVSLCLAADRFADALLLAVRGGADLLAKTQKAYFERRTGALPYLRLYQSIVSDDLTDVVQNADLGDWQEIFVVLCTFAKPDEYATLIEQLGQRLEYQFAVAKASAGDNDVPSAALEQRRSAVLCYLAARKLEKVVSIWKDEMLEEERQLARDNGGDKSASAQYSAHARALQSFIEKVTVFKSATGYVDQDLAHPTMSPEVAETGARIYRLSALYDKYDEYADLLSTQGLVTLAVKYAALTPADYKSIKDGVSTRERLQVALGKTIKAPTAAQQQPATAASRATYQPVASTSNSIQNTYQPVAPAQGQQQQQSAPQQQAYDDPYRPSGVPASQPSYTQQANAYAPVSNYAPASNGYSADPYNPAAFVPQMPAPITSPPVYQTSSQPASVIPPPAKKKDFGGWNDAPVVASKRPSSAASHKATPKVQPIFSPFPGGSGTAPQPYGAPVSYPGAGVSPAGPGLAGSIPPPPPLSRNATGSVPPPPRRGENPQQRPPVANMPPQQQQPGNVPRMQSPPQNMMQGPPQSMMQGPPQMQGPGMMQRPPQGMMPPPQQQGMPPQQRFGPPMQQGMPPMQGPPQGQYGPPQGMQQQHPQQNFVAPPPPRQQR